MVSVGVKNHVYLELTPNPHVNQSKLNDPDGADSDPRVYDPDGANS